MMNDVEEEGVWAIFLAVRLLLLALALSSRDPSSSC